MQLPARDHYEIARKPFLRESDGLARILSGASGGPWNVVVREQLGGGGSTGHGFGHVWEEFLAKSFSDSDWTVIGRNIRVSGPAGPSTEVDLLLFREDLLLVAEVKALAGSGVSPYDHLKNRRTIEKGCEQARLACAHIRASPKLLQSIASRRIAERVRRMEPVVFTNVSTLEGWSHAGVQVLSETLRKAITEGARVDYEEPRTGRVLGTTHFLRREERTTEAILDFIKMPVELRIAPEDGSVGYRSFAFEGIEVHLPRFVHQERDGQSGAASDHRPSAS